MDFNLIVRHGLSIILLWLTLTGLATAKIQSWQTLLTAEQKQARVNLSLNNTPLRDIFKLLAQQLSLNLIISDTVTGTASLQLHDVHWADAIDSLAASHKLYVNLNDKVLWISDSPPPELAPDPASPELIAINFARAVDIAALLQTGPGFVSAAGSISVDERTNTLIVVDSPAQIAVLKSLIKQLDRPVRQVMIEARMVSLKANIAEEFGVRWGASEYGLNLPADNNVTFIKGMQVDLPAVQPAATVGLNVARLSDDLLLDLELTALERENKGEIIASPKIFTANQQPAYIEQGTEIPYVESAASGATAVQFKKAVMGLRVTPQITPNKHVLLDLTITQNTRGDTVSTPTGPAVAIDTQEMGTQVLVKDGETIVLGGIFQTLELNDSSSVPIFSALPLLGNLFQHRQYHKEKRELVIFVTPTILDAAE
ncbi:MAG: type IV pilus secretin PilQ [Pseudomonadota bacterium]